jgi:hypothetical protein
LGLHDHCSLLELELQFTHRLFAKQLVNLIRGVHLPLLGCLVPLLWVR